MITTQKQLQKLCLDPDSALLVKTVQKSNGVIQGTGLTLTLDEFYALVQALPDIQNEIKTALQVQQENLRLTQTKFYEQTGRLVTAQQIKLFTREPAELHKFLAK